MADKVIYNFYIPLEKREELKDLIRAAKALWYLKKQYHPEAWEVIYEALRLLVKDLEQ